MEMTRELFDKLKEEGFFKGKIISGSMVPVIQIGEEIIVSVLEENLKRFDIIVFLMDGKLVCHYLWSMNRQVEPILLQTRSMVGGVDLPIKREDYLGKVLSHRLSFFQKLKLLVKHRF